MRSHSPFQDGVRPSHQCAPHNGPRIDAVSRGMAGPENRSGGFHQKRSHQLEEIREIELTILRRSLVSTVIGHKWNSAN